MTDFYIQIAQLIVLVLILIVELSVPRQHGVTHVRIVEDDTKD